MSLGTQQFISIMLAIPAIMLATTLHEATRALISTLLGDETPRKEKRLTLNPLKHFEPIGFLLMYSTGLSYGVGIGWGMPVNTNSRRYANRRVGNIMTAVWPSVINFLAALACCYALEYGGVFPRELNDFLALSVYYNLSLVVCNLIPVPPFDCIKVVVEFVSKKNYFSLTQSEAVMQLIMILLLFTGLLPMILRPVYNILAAALTILTL